MKAITKERFAILLLTVAVSGVPAFGALPSVDPPIDVPGMTLVDLPSVTPEESERNIHARVMPPGLITRSRRPDGQGPKALMPLPPPSIVELSRALHGDPDLIYEYVRNNIEYYPEWGVQKGPLGALLDGRGTAFDQAELMVELLTQAGWSASYVLGQITLSGTDLAAWLGVSAANACGVRRLLAQGQIPIATMSPSGQSGSCGALVSARVSHIWVKVSIGGTQYVFDPSYKPHTRKTAIDLFATSGYDANAYLTTARSGATITSDYVQNLNRTGVRNSLTSYATNLATYIRTNLPAGELADLVGGNVITPFVGGPLRQTALPYAVSTTQEWSTVPTNYIPTLTVTYAGISQAFTSDALAGSRLTITYDSSHFALLNLDGTLVQRGNTAVTFDASRNITLAVSHPTSAFLNQTVTQQLIPASASAANVFAISNSWGWSGRGSVEVYRTSLDNARAAGSADTSEIVLGSALAVLSATWITQTDRATYIADRLATTNTVVHHRIGIAGYNGAAYVDLPGNLVGVASETATTSKETTAFFNSIMHASIFESTAVQQTTTVKAVSTVKLLDIAVNPNNYRIYDAKSSNYSSAVQPNLVGCSASQLSQFNSYVTGGARLILPASCNLSEGGWTGVGYFKITSSSVGALIAGGLAGGFGTSTQSSSSFASSTVTTSITTNQSTVSTGPTFGDPVDMAKGHYQYVHSDLSVGVGAFPYSLEFTRLYSSGLSTQDGPLGRGWTHNFAITATAGSDGMQALGEDSALDAVATVVELMVANDLLSDSTRPLDKVVIATLGQRWFGDQLIDNSVTIRNGLNGELFIKLADGSYNSPPGNSAKLTQKGDGTYSYETVHKARMDFNAAGQISTYSLPNGVQAKFTYTGGNLASVANSFGRQLSFTTVSGRLTNVGDGSRSVSYTVASSKLTGFTDTLSNPTTYTYDAQRRLVSIFYPSNPTIAAMTNTYDSLGRVQTQANAFGKVYTYYFAGSRSDEVASDGSSNISYLDGLGNVLETINAVGQVTLNTYDGQSRLIRSILPELDSVEYDYDDLPCSAQNRCTHNVKTMRRIAKPGSGLPTLTSSFTYESAFNNVNHATDPRGQVTDYIYTAQGDVQTVTAPADAAGVRPTTTNTYTAFAPTGFPTFYLLTGTTRNIDSTHSTTTTTSYLTSNRYVPQTTILDQGTGNLNLTTAVTYDTVGNLATVDGPRTDVADTTIYNYDAERRLTKITDAKGKFTTFGYDSDGRRTRTSSQINTQWLVSCRTYTPSGHVLKTWGPALTAADTTCPTAAAPVAVTDYAYDDIDRLQRVTVNLAAVDGGNRVSEIDYWPDGNIKASRRAVGTTLAQSEVGYTYTANGRIATITDANGNVTTDEYDGLDRLVKTRFPDPASGASSTTDYEQYGYDNNANLTTLRTRSGQNVTLGYDNLNRATTRSYPAAAPDNLTFGYDLLGRTISANLLNGSYGITYGWDNAGRLLTATAGGKTLSYQYDGAGNRTRVTWPEATPFYVTTTYDELNRPTFIKEMGTTTLAQYAYDDLSRRATVTLPNATTRTYGYDSQGMLQSLANDLAGTAQDVTFAYTRNQAQDIKSTTWTNDLYAWTGVQDTRNFTSNRLNQYTSASGTTIGYDGNGNLANDGTWTYTYDAENRLRTANASGVTGSLAWDAAGRLRQTAISGTTTNLLYDDMRLVAEYDAAGNLLRRYVHGFGVDEPLVKYEGTGTTAKTWYYADHLGSVVATADSGGVSTGSFSYGPFGDLGSTTPTRFGYTGQQYIAQLALYHYKARFYSPKLARFLQPDPIRYEGGLNLYAYAGNNAINSNDPSGLVCTSLAGSLTCTTPGGITFTVPSPPGFPSRLGPGDANYHWYSRPVNAGAIPPSTLMQGVINAPVPGNAPRPASPSGTLNDATPSAWSLAAWMVLGPPTGGVLGAPSNMSPVLSYTTLDQNGRPVVVNVTLDGHTLYPGYVARYATTDLTGRTILINEGEGTSFLQSNRSVLANPIAKQWNTQSQDIIQRITWSGKP